MVLSRRLRKLFTFNKRPKDTENRMTEHASTSSHEAEVVKDDDEDEEEGEEEKGVRFSTVWSKHKGRDPAASNIPKVIKNVFCELRPMLEEQRLDPEVLARDVLGFLQQEANRERNSMKKVLLIEVLDVMATYAVMNRGLLREVLTALYSVSQFVDRSVILFEQGDLLRPVNFNEHLVARQQYILDNTAGWKIPEEHAVFKLDMPQYYLELPYRRSTFTANSTIMAEAMYRQQDAEFVLRLLRAGLMPSCLYLWPVCILIDLKYAIPAGSRPPTEDEILRSKEALMVRYFCRARHSLQVWVVQAEERAASIAKLPGEERSFAKLPEDKYDDILLIPPRAAKIIPEERYLIPSRLIHHSRLAVRKALLEADQLPRGIEHLPIPNILKRYVDLLMD